MYFVLLLHNNNTVLPSLCEICSFMSPSISFVPKRAKLAFARVLSSVLKEVIADNSVASWLKLMMHPKCILPSCKCRGHHNKPAPIEFLCDLWMQDQLGDLWNMALSRTSSTNKLHRTKDISWKQQVTSAISLAQDGLYSKACQALHPTMKRSGGLWKPSTPRVNAPQLQSHLIHQPQSHQRSISWQSYDHSPS